MKKIALMILLLVLTSGLVGCVWCPWWYHDGGHGGGYYGDYDSGYHRGHGGYYDGGHGGVAITGVEGGGVIIETRQQAVDIGIGISLPPPIVFVAPPEVIETQTGAGQNNNGMD